MFNLHPSSVGLGVVGESPTILQSVDHLYSERRVYLLGVCIAHRSRIGKETQPCGLTLNSTMNLHRKDGLIAHALNAHVVTVVSN